MASDTSGTMCWENRSLAILDIRLWILLGWGSNLFKASSRFLRCKVIQIQIVVLYFHMYHYTRNLKKINSKF